MALWTGKSYWQVIDTGVDVQPALQGTTTCDVAVLGAGITGARMAYYLGPAGVDVVLVDKRPLGTGSAAASTVLLQYEVNVPLADSTAENWPHEGDIRLSSRPGSDR